MARPGEAQGHLVGRTTSSRDALIAEFQPPLVMLAQFQRSLMTAHSWRAVGWQHLEVWHGRNDLERRDVISKAHIVSCGLEANRWRDRRQDVISGEEQAAREIGEYEMPMGMSGRRYRA